MTDLAAENAHLRAQLGDLDRQSRALRSARAAAARLKEVAAIERAVGPVTVADDMPAAEAEAMFGPLAALRRDMAAAAI